MLAKKLPDLPVPRVYNAYRIGEVSYIIMDYIPGLTVSKCWNELSSRDKDLIVCQLRIHVASLRTLKASYIGAIGEKPCQDSIFSHPYYSRHGFNVGVVEALRASRPSSSQYDPDLEKQIMATTGDEIVFTRGDLIPSNIIFNKGKVTIIDWGEAGYSIKEREFFWSEKRESPFPTAGAKGFPNLFPLFQLRISSGNMSSIIWEFSAVFDQYTIE